MTSILVSQGCTLPSRALKFAPSMYSGPWPRTVRRIQGFVLEQTKRRGLVTAIRHVALCAGRWPDVMASVGATRQRRSYSPRSQTGFRSLSRWGCPKAESGISTFARRPPALLAVGADHHEPAQPRVLPAAGCATRAKPDSSYSARSRRYMFCFFAAYRGLRRTARQT